jgi:hypothetical protein
MECELCGSPLKVCPENAEYHECTSCETQILKEREAFDTDFYASTYLTEDDDAVIKFLRANYNHYLNLYNNVLSKDSKFVDLVEKIQYNVKQCHCYGGGFPQLESILPVDDITIYDLIADKYEKHIDKYLNVYYSSKKIKYNVHDIKTGIVKVDEPSLFTFVHILEHFPIKDILKIFENLVDNVPKGSYITIYQPNHIVAKNKKWVHYLDQHVTFISIPSFIKLIEKYKVFSIEYSRTYSDDLLLVFKKMK